MLKMFVKPEVSVIIPAFNAERTIERTIFSVIELLADIPCEIIVVDDGSSDRTPIILAALSDECQFLRVFRQPNSGRSVARNRGISLASGFWIMFLDSDDYFLPRAREAFIRQLDNNFSTLVIFPMVTVRNDGSDLPGASSVCAQCESMTMTASDVLEGMITADAVERAVFSGYSYEFNSPWSRLYRHDHVLDLVEKEVVGFEPFPLGLRFSEDRLFNIAYLAQNRSQQVTFARCDPLYCWDVEESGTVSIARPDDGADILTYTERVGSLESSELISDTEAELLVAREIVNRLKRAVRLDSAGFEEAANIWDSVLSAEAVRHSLEDVGRGIYGTGMTGRWQPLIGLLATGQYGAALAYCRVLRNARFIKHTLGLRGGKQ